MRRNPDDTPDLDGDGPLEDKNKGDLNVQPCPNTTSQGSHPNMEMKSGMEQKEVGDISTYFTEGMGHHTQGGDMTSAQDDCFSAAQTSAEELGEEQLNIMSTLTEAGE